MVPPETRVAIFRNSSQQFGCLTVCLFGCLVVGLSWFQNCNTAKQKKTYATYKAFGGSCLKLVATRVDDDHIDRVSEEKNHKRPDERVTANIIAILRERSIVSLRLQIIFVSYCLVHCAEVRIEWFVLPFALLASVLKRSIGEKRRWERNAPLRKQPSVE